MRVLFLCSAVAFIAATVAEKLPSKSISKHKDTVLVLFGMRHGNRNPEHFLEENPKKKKFGFEGELELTSIGKRQALGLGRALRAFVGNGFISKNYLASEAKYFSSSAPRCQMTLQTALAGLYDPNDWGEWDKKSFDHWTPVPYTIDDPLLRMYAVKNCPASDDAWKPISEDTWEPLAKTAKEKKELLEYLHEKTGWKPSISVAADLADNLIEIDLFNATYPDWLEKPTLPGYDKKKIIKAYLEFAEAHQIACAVNKDCQKIMGGYWLKNLLDAFETAVAGKGPKVIGYASHTEVTLALMKLIGYDREELTTSAGFVIEVKAKPAAVRFLNHDPNPIDAHVIYKAALDKKLEKLQDKDGFIPIDKLKGVVSTNVIDDWEKACAKGKKKAARHRRHV